MIIIACLRERKAVEKLKIFQLNCMVKSGRMIETITGGTETMSRNRRRRQRRWPIAVLIIVVIIVLLLIGGLMVKNQITKVVAKEMMQQQISSPHRSRESKCTTASADSVPQNLSSLWTSRTMQSM